MEGILRSGSGNYRGPGELGPQATKVLGRQVSRGVGWQAARKEKKEKRKKGRKRKKEGRGKEEKLFESST
jgi:hypothetical protein